MPSCYVFDLDGTLANLEHRLHYIEGEKKDWPGFFQACDGDSLIEPIARLWWDLSPSNRIIMSGRSDEVRDKTEAWLKIQNLVPAALYMRKEGDYRADHVVKAEMMNQAKADGWEPKLIVDDRRPVVEMWRAHGFTVLHCAEGEY